MKRKNKATVGVIALILLSPVIVTVGGDEDEYEIIFDKGEDCKCEGLESLGIELVNCEASKYTTYTDGKADKYSGLRCVYAKQTYGPSGLDREVSIEMEIKCYKTVEEASDKFWEQANDYGKWNEKWDPTKPEKYEANGIHGAVVRNEGSNTRLSFIQKVPLLKNADTGEVRLDYGGETFFRYSEKYIIDIHGWAESSIFVQALDILERHAKAIIDGRKKISFKHYDPFEHFKPGMGLKIEPAGDLVATLKDKDGKGIEGERVIFYAIKEENPDQREPGKNLRGVLKQAPGLAFEAPIYDLLNIDQYTYLDVGYTDKDGEAKVNYILENLIDPKEFSKILVQQTYMHGEEGKIGGTIKTVILERKENEWKIKYEASIPIEFKGIAQIVKISGEGRSSEFKEAYLKEYPDSPKWGPGRVRVKRILTYPQFDYRTVEEGFLLMPGDIIDIDGNTKIEIVWINGNKATVELPDKIPLGGDVPFRPPHSRMILLPTAYDSGFHYPVEGIMADLFGFGINKGVDFLIESIPVVGKSAKIGVDIYRSITKEIDWSKQSPFAKIRIRSTVRIDSTGDNIKIYNIEGSPDIKTVKGEEVTLKDGEMVTVSEDGTLSEVQSFDPEKDLEEWSEYLQSSDSEEPSGPSLPSLGKLLPIIVIIVVIIIGALVAIPRMKKGKPIKTQKKGLRCPNCGTVNYEEDMFCVNCGAKLQKEGFFCPNCGAENKEDSMFCAECGEKLR